jgi:aspartate carbamoyltransferase catalytic subunit
MVRYPAIHFVLISPRELRAPDYVLDQIAAQPGCSYEESQSIEAAAPRLDILYMTRVQRERFFNEADYVRLKDSFILEPQKLRAAKPGMIVMHPLPRVNEITSKVDGSPHARYFEQAHYGVWIRMALILALLEQGKEGAIL